MPKIEISHDTTKNVNEIIEWLDENLANILRHKVPQDRFTLTWNDTHKTLLIKGRMVKGTMDITNQNVLCTINIPLLLRPFSSTIKAAVRDTLKKM